MIVDTSYTVQFVGGLGQWKDVHVSPHCETLKEANERIARGKLRNPESVYRILKVTREVVE